MAAKEYFKLFSDQAGNYAAFRPTYPAHVFQKIYDFATPGNRALALDCGTGQGQAAKELAKTYRKVIGMDANVSQLQQATPIDNVEFREGDVHATGLPASMVNLVTAAQAFHWFDAPRFYQEVRRVLAPQGAMALWGYDVLRFRGEPEASRLMYEFYSGQDKLGPYWSERRFLVDGHYKGVMPTDQDFKVIQHVEFDMTHTLDMEKLLGYLTSWSAYTTFCKQGGDGPALLAQLHADLTAALRLESGNQQFDVVHPLFMILAKEPCKEA